jgi:hypothetical protein
MEAAMKRSTARRILPTALAGLLLFALLAVHELLAAHLIDAGVAGALLGGGDAGAAVLALAFLAVRGALLVLAGLVPALAVAAIVRLVVDRRAAGQSSSVAPPSAGGKPSSM